MSLWLIDRSWRLHFENNSRESIKTCDLVGRPACCLLGSAGIGKTHEMKKLEELEKLSGYEVRSFRLATLASSTDQLTSALNAITSTASEKSAIYLDAVDEAMVPVATTSLILASWIRRTCSQNRPLLRISCRSAVWPDPVEAAINEIYGSKTVTIASLLPLTTSDILHIASTEGVDGESFTNHVVRANAIILSQQPLTLRMLLRLFKAHGGLPTSQRDLFSKAIDLLSHEREERRELGTATDIAPALILEAAERLACFSILSGSETIDLSDDPASSSLGWIELSALPSVGRPLDERLLKAIGCSGLCEGDGTNRFRFIHRQVAEYLAGRRLAKLPFHQARTLLCSSLGWLAGVAGPLRETTAFAAMESRELATWVSETDPEVIGLSDVADDGLRRRATLGLIEKFRLGELTDSQIEREGLPLAGLQYAGAEKDLQMALKERGNASGDALEFVINLIENWRLSSLGNDLADLVLDSEAPLNARVSAGYGLARSGTREERRRLLSLISGSPEDPEEELRGLALRCNWPNDLTTRDLLASLTPRLDRRFHGAYFGFIYILDQSKFDAADDRLAGLRWAKQNLQSEPKSDPTVRIRARIAHGALGEINQAGIAEALVELLLESARLHADSPLAAIRGDMDRGDEQAEIPAPLSSTEVRRRLLGLLAANATEKHQIWWVVHETPGLLFQTDYAWLLERACESSRSSMERENYAELSRMMPVFGNQESVEAWLRHREFEPVKTKLNYPLSMTLGSDEALQAKDDYESSQRRYQPPQKRKVEPPPEERVRHMLGLAETKDPQFFFNLCQELTLTEDSEHYGFERFLTRSPGWNIANLETRSRIIDAATRLLTSSTTTPEECRTIPLNTILSGYMPAVFLIMEQDQAWIESMTDEWWIRWSWYFLRELHPTLHDESDDLKVSFFRLLHDRVGSSVRDTFVELAKDNELDSRSMFTGLLGLCESIEDAELDQRLAVMIREGLMATDLIWPIARFLLDRDFTLATASCQARFDPSAKDESSDLAVEAAAALLFIRTSDAWKLAISFLEARPDLAKRVIGKYAHAEPGRGRRSLIDRTGFAPEQVGQLLQLHFKHFPPQLDPKHETAYWATRDDSIVELRRDLLGWLAVQKSGEALEALRTLERQFGAKYPGLRRVRSSVERAYRQTLWSQVTPHTVASLLFDDSKRLIRSGIDAIDGVVVAIELFEKSLHHAYPSSIEDLWNTPRGTPPTPKDEERISDKLCQAVRDYFQERALTAEREVQVYRRSVPKKLGGAPGSEVDLLISIPATGMSNNDLIAIPIEVKRSGNDEARTGLRDQLVDRYMSELGASYGIFVVVWLDAPGLPSGFKPIWSSPEDARADLLQQANDLVAETNGEVRVTIIVLDASLKRI
jgi:hypothetical protein